VFHRLAIGFALGTMCAIAVPASAQSTAPSTSVYGGLNLTRLEGLGGGGFTAGVTKSLDRARRFSVVGDATFTWYEFFDVKALQGGISVRLFQIGRAAVAARALTGVELCCGAGERSRYFSVEPGAHVTVGLTNRLGALAGFSIRFVNFEGETDQQRVLTLGLSVKIGR
jgi:hypothetical protein